MMKIIKEVINNNLDLKIIKTDKFKTTAIRFNFKMNLDYHDIAPFNLLMRLLTSRNSKYTSINSFSSYLEDNYGMTLYGNFFNRGNIAVADIFSSVIHSKYSLNEDLIKKQIEVMKDCLYNPLFTEEALSEVKHVYMEILKDQFNRKSYILQRKVNELLGNDSPYGVNIEGDIEAVKEVTLERIKDVYQKLLDSDCSIYACGDIEMEKLKTELVNFDLHNSHQIALDTSYLHPINDYGIKVFESKFVQSALNLVYECNIKYDDELFYALKVFLEMFNYDLFNIVREEHNFCYYIYSYNNNYLNTINIVSEIDSNNLDKVIALIEEILKGYRDNFDYQKFELSKKKILNYIQTSQDSSRDLIDLEFGFDFNNRVSSIEGLEDKYLKVTPEEVILVSEKISLKLVAILKEATNNE